MCATAKHTCSIRSQHRNEIKTNRTMIYLLSIAAFTAADEIFSLSIAQNKTITNHRDDGNTFLMLPRSSSSSYNTSALHVAHFVQIADRGSIIRWSTESVAKGREEGYTCLSFKRIQSNNLPNSAPETCAAFNRIKFLFMN